MPDPVYCRRCERPTVRIVYVIAVAGLFGAGPYGRRCARLTVEELAMVGIPATRRYGRA